jgi:hypothetical protein
MDTSNMDERQKEYIKLARDEVLAKKECWQTLEGAKCHGRDECTFERLWIHWWLWRLMEAWEHRRVSLEEAWGMGAPAGIFGGGMGSMASM